MKLFKVISSSGELSRRKSIEAIQEAMVTVNGQLILDPFVDVEAKDDIRLDDKKINHNINLTTILLNKPKGYISTKSDEKGRKTIFELIPKNPPLNHVGRLDKDTTGAILLTNDGDIVNKILRSRFKHEKEYLVTLNKKLTKDFLKKMENGVPILNTTTRKCKTTYINEFQFKIVLTQGLNRQIRRMCEHFEYRVKKLERIRIINIKLDIPRGKWRYLTVDEVKFLKKL